MTRLTFLTWLRRAFVAGQVAIYGTLGYLGDWRAVLLCMGMAFCAQMEGWCEERIKQGDFTTEGR